MVEVNGGVRLDDGKGKLFWDLWGSCGVEDGETAVTGLPAIEETRNPGLPPLAVDWPVPKRRLSRTVHAPSILLHARPFRDQSHNNTLNTTSPDPM